MRVLIAAGGTGGHVMPGLAVARALRAHGDEVLWLGTPGGLEARLVPAAGLPLRALRVRGLRGRRWVRWLTAAPMLGAALAQALWILARYRPAVVLGLGGFAGGPGGLAAWLLRRPLVLHEQNARPGLTNRLLGRHASVVLAGFPGVMLGGRSAEFVGNPVRAALTRQPPPALRGVGNGPLRLLVLGGSQGASALNRLLPEAVALLAARGVVLEVHHQAGMQQVEAVAARYAPLAGMLPVQVSGFIEDMAQAYAWASLVVCRAGALTLAELCSVGVGALLVPYPHAADDHQSANARTLVQAGAAQLLPEATLDALTLADALDVLAGDGALRVRMAQAARALARPQAAVVVAARCRAVARA